MTKEQPTTRAVCIIIGMNRLCSALAVCLLLAACDQQPDSLPLQHATLAKAPRPVAEFRLRDQADAEFTRTDLLGQWTLLFAGFTHCPDVCPNTLGLLKAAEGGLDGRPKHRVILLSVDPERDTPAVLREYLAWFDPAWTGLTGPAAEIDRLLTSLDMARVRMPTGKDNYTMDHSAAVVLLDPQARLVAYWKPPLDATQLARDLAALPAP